MKIQKYYVGLISIILLSSFIGMISGLNVSDDTPTFYVGGSGAGNFSMIQEAIDASSSGDTLFVYAGLYTENIVIDKAILLIGENMDTTILDGGFQDNVVNISASAVTIEGFTIQNSGRPDVEKENISDILNNTSDDSSNQGDSAKNPSDEVDIDALYANISYAGVYIGSDNSTVVSCHIRDCHLGIVSNAGSSMLLSDCNISDNSVGISIYKSKYSTINNIRVFNNEQGISFSRTNLSKVTGSIISQSNGTGFSMSDSSHNIIYGNMITNNYFGVVVSTRCIENIFYKNNFIANEGMQSIDNSLNQWDYDGTGNYWDDYTGSDEDADGIGDQPYIFTLIGEDDFPLIDPVETQSVSPMNILVKSPKDDAVVSGVIIINGTIESAVDIKEVFLQIDSESYLNISGENTWEVEYDTSNLSNGLHSLTVYGLNVQGDIEVTQVSFTVANTVDSNTQLDDEGSDESPSIGLALLVIMLVGFILYRKIR